MGFPPRREMELCSTRDRPGRSAMPNRIHPISEPRPVQAALKDSDNDSLEFFAPEQMRAGLRRYRDLEAESP